MTGCLAAKWGMIQNGGQGRNSIPRASATDPDPQPFQCTPLLCVFTTGYRHLAFIISSETQSASDGQLPQRGGPSLTWRCTSLPVHNTWRQSLRALLSEWDLAGIYMFKCLSLNATELTHVLDSGWKGDFGFQFHNRFTIKSIKDIKAEKKIIKDREETRKAGGKNESWNAHGTILCTSLLPNNIYASSRSPDKVMDSRGDFACAWK